MTCSDPFLCLYALKIIYLSLLAQFSVVPELSLPFILLSAGCIVHSNLCKRQFKGSVSASWCNLNEVSSPLPVWVVGCWAGVARLQPGGGHSLAAGRGLCPGLAAGAGGGNSSSWLEKRKTVWPTGCLLLSVMPFLLVPLSDTSVVCVTPWKRSASSLL